MAKKWTVEVQEDYTDEIRFGHMTIHGTEVPGSYREPALLHRTKGERFVYHTKAKALAACEREPRLKLV